MKTLIFILLLLTSGIVRSQTALPVPDHIVFILLENHAYSQIIGSSAAPYINSLINDANTALFTASYALQHPSQPNYLDLFAGCNQGVNDDNVPAGIPFTTPNLARQLINAGRTFITYSEDLPSVGFNGASSGQYARKHNPAANWMGTGTNQIPTTTNQPFTAFPAGNFAALPTVSYVVPNQNNEMHNGTDPTTITVADTWINQHLSAYIQWAKTHNSLFILTFDEDDNNNNNHIPTLFTGQMVKGGRYAEVINHYTVLRTVEDFYGLPRACNAATATTITDCWTTAVGIPPAVSALVSLYPNPVRHQLTVEIPKINGSDILTLTLINVYGARVKEVTLNTLRTTIPLDQLAAGLYFYQFKNRQTVLSSGKIVVQ